MIWNVSYSYLNAKKLLTAGYLISSHIAQNNQFRTFLSYMPIKYIGFDLTYTFVSKRNYDNQSIWYELPNYSIFDFGITSKPIKYFTFWFKINNLLDRNYVSAFDQPLPGREFRIGLTFDFKVPSK
ncbi:MAG: TonB-dependent receptor [Bacteroidetes bacterium]|nr:TonB-dependent receptor [Bacteroidota bacterium]